VFCLEYRIEFKVGKSKVKIEDSDAELPEMVQEFYRALRKICPNVNAEYLKKLSAEAIDNVY
jgi:hypothetical protein